MKKKHILIVLMCFIGLGIFATDVKAVSWDMKKQCFENIEAGIFESDSKWLTADTMCYRSGNWSYYDAQGNVIEENYTCTQGRDSQGNLVPITQDCLMPFDNLFYSKNGTNFSYYKKNDKGLVIGTNNPAEAYTIREIGDPGEETRHDAKCVYVDTYQDAEGAWHITRVMPSVKVKVTFVIDWEQCFQTLDMINRDRANYVNATTGEKDPREPLVMDKRAVEAAIYRNAELAIVSQHGSCFNGKLSGRLSNAFFPFGTLQIDGENITTVTTGGWSIDQLPTLYDKVDLMTTVFSESAEKSQNGYHNSTGHYETYCRKDLVAAGICFGMTKYSDIYHPEVFCSGNKDAIEPMERKTGREIRTVEVALGDTGHFDYKIKYPISELTLGETKKLAAYAAPVDWWVVKSFTGDFRDLEDAFYANYNPFDFNSLTFTSSDPSIATVDSDGKVTGVKEGTVTIQTSLQGKHKKDMVITVKKKKVVPSVTVPVTTLKPANNTTGKHNGSVKKRQVATKKTTKVIFKFKKGDKLQYWNTKTKKWNTIKSFKKPAASYLTTKDAKLRIYRKEKVYDKKKKCKVYKWRSKKFKSSQSVSITKRQVATKKTTKVIFKFKKGDKLQYWNTKTKKWNTIKSFKKPAASYLTTKDAKLRICRKEKVYDKKKKHRVYKWRSKKFKSFVHYSS